MGKAQNVARVQSIFRDEKVEGMGPCSSRRDERHQSYIYHHSQKQLKCVDLTSQAPFVISITRQHTTPIPAVQQLKVR